MNRVSFLGSLLAMVGLGPVLSSERLQRLARDLRAVRPSPVEEQLRFQRAKDALEARFRFDVEEWSFVEPVPDPNDFDWVSYPRG